MRILLLSPYPEIIAASIHRMNDDVVVSNAPPLEVDFSADFVISFGYRHILKEALLKTLARPIINIHISYLPWNRGSDPNFWSWFDDTPKGVTIHEIDAGIDTGPIIAQREVEFYGQPTLASTYFKLKNGAADLFSDSWPFIRSRVMIAKPQIGTGSYHRSKDKEPWWKLLPKGYDTPVEFIQEMGAEHHASVAFVNKYDEDIAKMSNHL